LAGVRVANVHDLSKGFRLVGEPKALGVLVSGVGAGGMLGAAFGCADWTGSGSASSVVTGT
jgi:hypothetical protein